jgi:hypothetical protein
MYAAGLPTHRAIWSTSMAITLCSFRPSSMKRTKQLDAPILTAMSGLSGAARPTVMLGVDAEAQAALRPAL